jgi:2-polyprenyl-6-methoxyphenol hydroxylase-like FAD-dependent oxidoreductase
VSFDHELIQEEHMTTIGIIGAGVAGLHLGLLLQKYGVAATIYAEKTPEQQLAGQLRNIVVRSAPPGASLFKT